MEAERTFESPLAELYSLSALGGTLPLKLELKLFADSEFANSEPKPEEPVAVAWLRHRLPCCGRYGSFDTSLEVMDVLTCEACHREWAPHELPMAAAFYALLWRGTSFSHPASEETKLAAAQAWAQGAVDPLTAILAGEELYHELCSFVEAAFQELLSRPWPAAEVWLAERMEGLVQAK